MAIQTRLVGTLGGGATVESQPVSAGPAASQTITMATVTVPAGERWLVVVTGNLTGGTNTAPGQQLAIGTIESIVMSGPSSHVAEVTGTATVRLITGFQSSGFTGTLHTIRL